MNNKFGKINKRSLIAIIGVILVAIISIPMLYSSIYLSAFWDTYGNINKVPVAFVNLDKNISNNEQNYCIGKDVEINLKDNDKVKWNFVDYDEAKSGVENSSYYAMVVIPENFSQKLLDSKEGKFEKPEIIYEGNKGRNFVFSQISQRVAESIKANVAENIQKETSKAIVNNLNEMKSSIKDASEGAGKIYGGTQQLLDGSAKISCGTLQAKNGSEQLQNGLKEAADGENKVLDGTDTLISRLNTFKESLTQKNSDIDELVSGANNVADKVSLITDNVDKQLPQKLNGAANGVDDVSKAVNYAQGLISVAINNLKANGNFSEADKQNIAIANSVLESVKDKDISKNIAAPLRGASTTAQSLVDGIPKLQEGTVMVANGTSKLAKVIVNTQAQAAAGANQLIAGANQLKDGSNSLLKGLNTAAVSAGKLKDGLIDLNNGALSLSNGLNSVNNGVSELNNGLRDGYIKINDNLKFTSDDMANFMAGPVVLKDQSINEVKYYGEGLAPYFISLSLWLGAMFTNLGFTIIKRIRKFNSKVLDSFMVKFLIGSIIAALQAVLLSFVLVKGLRIDTVNVNYFYLFNVFIALVFFSIMYSASDILGIVATPIMFIIFLLQLSSSGGTFPIETAPKFFRVIGEYFPMTYSINGLRMITSGINPYILKEDICVLLGFMIGFLILSFLARNVVNYFKTTKNETVELTA